jgi:D-beta-D-heptose 7-phosphate kinase / D-beta-D-heptose 1-phosphate adenosyltransferase
MQFGQVLRSVSQRRVLILGDLILDEYVAGHCDRISPEAPVPIVRFAHSRPVPGGAANAAANIAALGGAVTLVGLLGDDPGGHDLSQECRALGIRLIPFADGRLTTRKVRVIAQQQQLLRLDYDYLDEIDSELEGRIVEAVTQEIDNADIVVMSDYAKGLLTHRLCQQVLALSHAAAKPVIIDPRPQHGPYYIGCDYLTPNWSEALRLLGETETAPRDETIGRVGTLLRERFRCNIVLTLGSRGIAYFGSDPHDAFVAPAVAKEVFDVSGAGDTVVAAFALAIAAGCSPQEAVSLANRAAGIVVGKHGTATVTPTELLADTEAEPRLLAREHLRGLSAALKAEGKRVVTVDGLFDGLHPGHLHVLREARRQGDVVIVGLNSDSSVRSYDDAARPIVPERQRAAMLLALRDVAYVHIFNEPTPVAFLAEVQPDVHVNAASRGDDRVEARTVTVAGGRLHLVEHR